MNEDVVINEIIDKDYVIEEVCMVCKYFGDLYFYFFKVLFEEFGEDKISEILRKVLFERFEERVIVMRERVYENGDELIVDNIISIIDVLFLGWVFEFEELYCFYGVFWFLRFEENFWFKKFVFFYCDVIDIIVVEVFIGDIFYKIIKNILWGDKSCERIYFYDDKVFEGKYIYGNKNCK